MKTYSSEISNDGIPVVLILRISGGGPRVGDGLTPLPGDGLADEQVERIEVRGAEPELRWAGPAGGEAHQEAGDHQKQRGLEILINQSCVLLQLPVISFWPEPTLHPRKPICSKVLKVRILHEF